MVWREVAFRTLSNLAVTDDTNALNNPLLTEALLEGHVATQVLAIRKLMDDRRGDIISLRRLVKDLRHDFHLFTRENYVCHDGLPYDYQAVRQKTWLQKLGQQGGFVWMPIHGPEADGTSELAHTQFDALAGIDSAKRSRDDRLPDRLLTTIEGWLDASGADDLKKWSNTYLAHSGGPC
jgi:hypothetical protein